MDDMDAWVWWILDWPHNHNQAVVPAVAASVGGLRGNVRVGRREASRAAVTVRQPADVHGDWPRAMRSNAAARRWHAAGHPTRALPLARAALAIVEREQGPECAEAVDLCLGLSVLYEQLSKYDMAEAYAQWAASVVGAATDATESVSVDGSRARSLRIRVLARLGAIERVRGGIDEAERLYREALELAEAATSTDELVAVLCGLGTVYKDFGRFDEAEALYRRALTIARPDGVAAASLWHNLGGLDHARGQYAAGESAARRSVALRTAAVGSQHPSVAADQAALASLLAGQGKYAEAEALYRRALSVFEHVYPPNSYEIAVTCNDLGVLLAARGDVERARGYYQRALRIKQTILGAEHPEVALTRMNLERSAS